MPAWVDNLLSLVGVGKGLPYTLFRDLDGNAKAAGDHPFCIEFNANGASSSHPTFQDIGELHRDWCPKAATTLRITLQARVASSSGYAKAVIDDGTTTTDSAIVSGITNTSFGSNDQNEITFVFSDISAYRGKAVSITFEVANDAGALTELQCNDRSAHRWGFD